MHQVLQVYQVYTVISTGLYFSRERSFWRDKSRRNPDEKHSFSSSTQGHRSMAVCRDSGEVQALYGTAALHTAVCPVAAGIWSEVENIRTLQSHDFWESSYQNRHPTLASVLSVISSFPFSLSFAHPLLGISSISPPLSSPFPCSRLFPDDLSSPNVYLPLLGPLLLLLPGRWFLLH